MLRQIASITAALVFLLALVALAGCGDDDEETETVTVTTEAGESADAGEQGEGSEEELVALREEVGSLRSEVEDQKDPGEAGTAAPSGFKASSCGSGVYVKAKTTSCAFALNVAADFFSSPGYTFYSYSPTTGQTYLVRCTRSYPVLCKAGSARVVIT